MASGTKSGTIILWEIPKYRKSILAKKLSEVQTLAFTPDGENLISGEKSGIVNVWLPKSGLKSQPLESQLSSVNSVSFSSNGNFVAIGSDESLEIWDFRNRNRIYSKKNNTGINSVAFSPNSQFVGIGFKDGNIKIWNIEKERYLQSNCKHDGEVTGVIFSNNNQILATCSEDKSIKIWQY